MNKKVDIDLKEGVGIKIAVDIAIFNDKGQVLLGKRLAKAGFGSWGFPGGHLKMGEQIKKGAQREIEEELGGNVEIKITNRVLSVRENCISPHFIHHVTIIIQGLLLEGEPKLMEPDRCGKWEWFDLNSLPTPLFSGIEEIIENYQKNKVLVVTDWEE